MLEIKQSMKEPARKQRIGLIAAPKHGKTFTAASMSEKLDPTFAAPQDLTDIFWFLFDTGGLDGLTEKRVNIPHFDFTDCRGEKELREGLKDGFEHIRKIASGPAGIKTLVLDTVSALDKTWADIAHAKYGKGYGLLDEMLANHNRFFLNEVKNLPCHVVLLFHPKQKPATQADKQETLEFDQIMDLTGSGAGVYRAHLSLLSQVQKTEVKGKPDEWNLISRGRGGIERFSRYACIQEREPANLFNLYKKIKAVMETK